MPALSGNFENVNPPVAVKPVIGARAMYRDVDALFNEAMRRNSEVAHMWGFKDRLEAAYNAEDRPAFLKEQIGIVQLGTDIQHDIAQTLAGINTKKLIALTIHKSFWGRLPFFKRFQAPDEITIADNQLNKALTDLRDLKEFIANTVTLIKPKYDVLQQSALIAAVMIPDDVQRIVMLQSAVQAAQMLLLTLANCIIAIDRDVLSIEQLLEVTIPTWALARAQKKLLSISKPAGNVIVTAKEVLAGQGVRNGNT